MKALHLSSMGLAAVVPLACISPTSLIMPVDIALGILIPIHAHVGMNAVISDYVPKSGRSMARYGWLGITGISILGLLRLNTTGDGLTGTIKRVWQPSFKGETL